jgi:branched-chain amino acid aminotransferase
MSLEKWVYVDGDYCKKEEAKVSVFDHGYLYGDGIFEGIRFYNGRVFKLDEHIERLYMSAKAIFMEIPMTKQEMIDALLETIRRNNLRDGYIRLVVSRGKGDLGLSPTKCPKPFVLIIADSITLYPNEMYEKGMKVITASTRRNNPLSIDPQVKSLNYMNNILAKIEANRVGVPEAIMLNNSGYVAECTGDNIFIVKDGIVYTPPIHVGVLDGITRKTAMYICEKMGIEVYEKEFTLYNVYNADECFLTGTAAEAIAVTEADERIIGNGRPGPITKRILEAFRDIVKNEGTDIY